MVSQQLQFQVNICAYVCGVHPDSTLTLDTDVIPVIRKLLYQFWSQPEGERPGFVDTCAVTSRVDYCKVFCEGALHESLEISPGYSSSGE